MSKQSQRRGGPVVQTGSSVVTVMRAALGSVGVQLYRQSSSKRSIESMPAGRHRGVLYSIFKLYRQAGSREGSTVL